MLFTPPNAPALDTNANPLSGAKWFFYLTGTTTPADVYTTEARSVAHANPVVADSAGRFAPIFLDPEVSYRATLKTAGNVEIEDYDPLNGAIGAGDLSFSYDATYPAGSLGAAKQRGDTIMTEDPYFCDATGATDCAAAIAQAYADRPKAALFFPEGTYQVASQQTFIPPAIVDSFGAGVSIIGAGSEKTFFDNRVANGFMFVADAQSGAHASFVGNMGARFEGFTIKTTTSPVASGGIKTRACYNPIIRQVNAIGLSGTFIKTESSVGDNDANNMPLIAQTRAQECGKWGYDLAGEPGFNENSLYLLEQCFAAECGTDESLAITAISKSNPAVVTVTGTAPANGSKVYLCGVGGMVEVDSFTADRSYTVASRTATTFELAGVNSSGFTTFTSGGRVLPREPQSGGFKLRNQIVIANVCATTQCKNVGTYFVGGAGLSQDTMLNGFTNENPSGFGVLIQGTRNLKATIPHVYSNQTFSGPNYAGWLIDGEESVCRNIIVEQAQVRATAAETSYTAFKVFGANADTSTIIWRNTDWKQFDFTGQKRFGGVSFPSFQTSGELVVLAVDAIRFRPSTSGNGVPLKLVGPAGGGVPSTTGELVNYIVPSAGINRANTVTTGGAALANSTTYYAYAYDAYATLGRPDIEFSTTAPVADYLSGRWVKTGDDSRTWVGRTITDGSGQFVTTNLHWLNPTWVAGSWMWTDSTGDVRTKTTLPTGDTDGTIIGTQT